MKPSPYFYGKLERGKFTLNNRSQMENWLRSQPDGNYQTVIQPRFKPRTTGQPEEDSNWNGYYWGVIIEILHEEMGLTRPKCHEEMKLMFNPIGYQYKFKSEVRRRIVGGSTAKMSDRRFKKYCQDIRMWAADPHEGFNCYIPEPHEAPEALQSLMQSYRDYGR